METKDYIDFIRSLSIFDDNEWYFNKTTQECILNFDNSEDFIDVFNTISMNNNLKVDKTSVATENESFFIYTDGVFDIQLEANYDKDVYKITVKER